MNKACCPCLFLLISRSRCLCTRSISEPDLNAPITFKYFVHLITQERIPACIAAKQKIFPRQKGLFHLARVLLCILHQKMTFVFPSINGSKPEERSGHIAVHYDGYIVVWGGYHRVRIDYHFKNKRLGIHPSGDTLTFRFIGSPEIRNHVLPTRCSAVASCLCRYFKILSPASPEGGT